MFVFVDSETERVCLCLFADSVLPAVGFLFLGGASRQTLALLTSGLV